MSSRPARSLALALLLAGCASAPSAPDRSAPVRSSLTFAGVDAEDPSLLVARYAEVDAEGRARAVDLDHSHAPGDEDEGDEADVRVLLNGAPLPIQAVDAVGDRVLVDLDALPLGRQTLRLSVAHEGLVTDWLEVVVVDRRPESP